MYINYYEPIDIWSEPKDGILYCYTLFKRLRDNKFAVQSKDAYQIKNMDECIRDFNKQRVSLFIEESIEERGIFADSIESAIMEFEHSFND